MLYTGNTINYTYETNCNVTTTGEIILHSYKEIDRLNGYTQYL